ncbi:MAG: hypothetical protein LBO71_01750 [Prevotellaceae bacterium]|jgi:hypothetical protein|nr:hypothetical protein [Prevotellaceae bacterium]
MKNIHIILALIVIPFKSYSVGVEVSYNATLVSFANVQFSARNIVDGFGLYTSIRGLSNGSQITGSNKIYDELLSMQKAGDKFEISHHSGQILRSGVSFGINKQWKFLFIGVAAGYCDIINYQETAIKSDNGTAKLFSDQNGMNRKLELEAICGSVAEYDKFYIPFYFGYSYNYSIFAGLGFGWKF